MPRTQKTPLSAARALARAGLRKTFAGLPRDWRHAIYRALVDCELAPDPRLQLKIADTCEELEACFRLLHDAYVASGFMTPDPSGLRVTIYHALPTTTTLCAKWDGRVVGTLSMIRDGVFGFPLQSAYDLTALRARGGNIAEVSALAVDPAFRRTGGKVLFPLMKFMYAYCREYFDTRHLVIAVNPAKIELYEALLGFERLPGAEVDHYDFANGAPAVGAALDLARAAEDFRVRYAHRGPRRNLHHYFVEARLPHIQLPPRRFHTTNDPVMTPAMLDHFFNRRTQVFASLGERQRLLLRSIYDLEAYAPVLPLPALTARVQGALRRHRRFSLRCPAQLQVRSYGSELTFALQVVEISEQGLLAECTSPLPQDTEGRLEIDLGLHEHAVVRARAVRCQRAGERQFYGLAITQADAVWRDCVAALQQGQTQADLLLPGEPAAPAADAPPRPARHEAVALV